MNVKQIKRKIYTEAHRRQSELVGEIDNLRMKMNAARDSHNNSAMWQIRNHVDALLIEKRSVDSMVARYEARAETLRQDTLPAKKGTPAIKVARLKDVAADDAQPCRFENAGFSTAHMAQFAAKGWRTS